MLVAGTESNQFIILVGNPPWTFHSESALVTSSSIVSFENLLSFKSLCAHLKHIKMLIWLSSIIITYIFKSMHLHFSHYSRIGSLIEVIVHLNTYTHIYTYIYTCIWDIHIYTFSLSCHSPKRSLKKEKKQSWNDGPQEGERTREESKMVNMINIH